jgi:hypothetical protein
VVYVFSHSHPRGSAWIDLGPRGHGVTIYLEGQGAHALLLPSLPDGRRAQASPCLFWLWKGKGPQTALGSSRAVWWTWLPRPQNLERKQPFTGRLGGLGDWTRALPRGLVCILPSPHPVQQDSANSR